jgi:hypothetical protein
VRVIDVKECQRRERLTVLRAKKGSGRGGPGRGLTHKGPDVTVRSTSPLRRFVLGFLETERVAGAVCSASFGVEHESGEKAIMEAPRKSMQKVRLKP